MRGIQCKQALLLALAMMITACNAQSPESPSELSTMLAAEGEILYAGLYALPQTRDTFLVIAGDKAWQSHMPNDIPGQLSAEERKAVIDAVQNQFDILDSSARNDLLNGWHSWLIAWRQYQVFTDLYHAEGTMAAAFAIPITQSLFHEALEQRGLDPETVTPALLGTTLAAAERAKIVHRWLEQMSGLSREEQANYYAEFYGQLIELAHQI
jgi:hypothetical protein